MIGIQWYMLRKWPTSSLRWNDC